MFLAYKPSSLTPLQLLDQLRTENRQLRTTKLAYAGRLDPMAEGEMLILVGDECKQRAKYQNLDKIYEVDIAFGFATDTGDGMGLINPKSEYQNPKEDLMDLTDLTDLKDFVGTFEQPYPSYSSKTVDGVPLYRLAREGRVSELPTKRVTIYEITPLNMYERLLSEVIDDVISRVLAVQGDFRQEKIIHQWQEIAINTKPQLKIPVLKIRVHCSSGTYMRSLAQQIGERVGIPAFAWKIKRTQIVLEK